MKKRLLSAVILLIGLTSLAPAQSLLELIAQIDSASLADYVSPLAKSYGCAMGTGWAQSAKSHKFLGFDLGVRLMVIQIPEAGRTFDAHVRYCYFDSSKMDTVWRDTIIQDAATMFGKKGSDDSWVPSGAIGIPPALPGGLGVSIMPFLVPQASVGLPVGAELTVRYVPWPFKGTTVQFLGFGLKEEVSRFLAGGKLPLNLAAQVFYQKFLIGDELNSNTWGGQVLASFSFLGLSPHAGIGFDKTSMNINYTFKFNDPRFELGPPPRFYTEEVELPVAFNYDSGLRWRGNLGATATFGLMFVSLDLNRDFTSAYNSITLGTGLSIR